MTIIIIYYEQSRRNDFAIESTGCDHISDWPIVRSPQIVIQTIPLFYATIFYKKCRFSWSSAIVTCVTISFLLVFSVCVCVLCDNMWFFSNKYQVLFIIVLTATYDVGRCDAITNTNFNSHLRDYSAVDINVSGEGNIRNEYRNEQDIITCSIFISEYN